MPYRVSEHGGIEWQHQTRDGPVCTELANFTATISADVAHDDGSSDLRRVFELRGAVGNRPPRTFSVPAAQFAGMGWVSKELGASAFIAVGQLTREHLRLAIQRLSVPIPERRVFTHTGWRQVDGAWLYLYAGGAIGAAGSVAGVETALSSPLDRYALPDPSAGEARVAAVCASLGLLTAAPDPISLPLLAAVYRAALGGVDFSLHLAGGSGAFKTALAVLAQQHWGDGLDVRHLPANWTSTANSLEGLAFLAADALLVVDDFVPTGSAVQVQQLHAAADRILRGQGNGSGRGRMNADGTLRPAKPPRGLILSPARTCRAANRCARGC